MKKAGLIIVLIFTAWVGVVGQVPNKNITYKCIKAFIKGTNEPVPEDIGRVWTYKFYNGSLYINEISPKRQYKYVGFKGNVHVYEKKSTSNGSPYWLHFENTIKISSDLSRVNYFGRSITNTPGQVPDMTEIMVLTSNLDEEVSSGMY